MAERAYSLRITSRQQRDGCTLRVGPAVVILTLVYPCSILLSGHVASEFLPKLLHSVPGSCIDLGGG